MKQINKDRLKGFGCVLIVWVILSILYFILSSL